MKKQIIEQHNQSLNIGLFLERPISRGRFWMAVLWLYLIASSWFLATARGSTPPPADPIGTAVATYELINAVGGPTNSKPYGLAYDFVHYPRRLYVSDTSNYPTDYIFVYQLDPTGLTELSTERIFTGFDDPRGLAISYLDKVEYLYVLESNSLSTGGLENRLWRYDMLHKSWDYVDLNQPGFGIVNRELLGLEYYNGDVFVGYDTSGMADEVRYGILRVKVIKEAGGPDWWSLAKAADPSAIIGHLPNGGRGPFSGYPTTSKYERDPCRGLAAMVLGDTFYLWGTSLGSYVYSADGTTGRGLFYFESPTNSDGIRYQHLYDLAFGGNYLWAVEQTDANHHNVIHKFKVASDFNVPLQSGRHVRRITMTLNQETTGSGLGRIPNGVLHSYMLPNSNTLRPNQDRDLASLEHWGSKKNVVDSSTYDPAGDASCRQERRNVHFTYKLWAKELESDQMIDVWTSDYWNFVYPHLCSTSGVPTADYLATTTLDDSYINGLTSDPTTYNSFMAEVNGSMVAEYGPTAMSTNPYWIARNISEFLREHFDYGKPDKMKEGEGVWNPVQYKLQRHLEGDTTNDFLTCSSTAFVTEALCRSVSVPARWVGTTCFRDLFLDTDGNDISWDADSDGLMGSSEASHDQNYHRWAEVWLGSTYRWQRFDGTPAEARSEQSQWEMMDRCAHGVDSNDLVTTVGKGFYDGMYNYAKKMQYYNSCAHYDGNKWQMVDESDDPDVKAIYWSVPCYIYVDTPFSPQAHSSLNVTWALSGRWDLDKDPTVSIYAEPSGTTDQIQLATGIPASAGSAAVDLSELTDGMAYKLCVIKDGDAITGGRSDIFLYDTTP